MKEIITDIAFIIFATAFISRIVWEVIPDCVKKYWSYQKQTRKDHKVGWFNRRWIWIFKNGRQF